MTRKELEKQNQIKYYDNGGDTLDRYTVVYL